MRTVGLTFINTTKKAEPKKIAPKKDEAPKKELKKDK